MAIRLRDFAWTEISELGFGIQVFCMQIGQWVYHDVSGFVSGSGNI